MHAGPVVVAHDDLVIAVDLPRCSAVASCTGLAGGAVVRALKPVPTAIRPPGVCRGGVRAERLGEGGGRPAVEEAAAGVAPARASCPSRARR